MKNQCTLLLPAKLRNHMKIERFILYATVAFAVFDATLLQIIRFNY